VAHAGNAAAPGRATPNESWRSHLLETDAEVDALLARTRRIAVLGIKIRPEAPAYFVPEYLASAGYDVVPVPVYYPEVTEILGRRVYRALAQIPGPVDLVDVFRRPRDIPAHVEDILTKRPAAVWLQLGIRHDVVAEILARAGIDVVQDRCLMVDARRARIQDSGGRSRGTTLPPSRES
jgi:predicted CoA-binding protein